MLPCCATINSCNTSSLTFLSAHLISVFELQDQKPVQKIMHGVTYGRNIERETVLADRAARANYYAPLIRKTMLPKHVHISISTKEGNDRKLYF